MKHKKFVKYRRKYEGKTDYRKRLKLLSSNIPRLVVRRMLNNILLQVIKYEPNGDHVIVTTHSREITKFGWKGHKGSLPAAYLTGLLCGKKAKAKVKKLILDLGLQSPIKGSVVYAALKGVVDAGIDVAHSAEIYPSEERLKGKHIADYAKLLSQDKVLYEKRFSNYLKLNLKPEEIVDHFEKIKLKIMELK
ncbi:MAG: 50S ribosomal protein L18 [Candidatus Woesearchaeota archaeon]|nr:MAG: 50S ribosomal protein L18 [Candidatus Woesearchaeota archaeon]